MLVIRRREGEEIIINETTRIRILKLNSGNCQIGIDAPLSETVRRGELIPRADLMFHAMTSLEGSD
ncbi:MAG: carbon storage regulator [Planctomyces sp.]|jgi:carbon storage regulator CsrA|nr:carbon storage regulator [Planctomyces sp.]